MIDPQITQMTQIKIDILCLYLRHLRNLWIDLYFGIGTNLTHTGTACSIGSPTSVSSPVF
jgi:hypothetical protein